MYQIEKINMTYLIEVNISKGGLEMKKYLPILFILAIACAFSVSAVTAVDLEKQDFDGKFTMDVIKGSDFERTEADGVVTFLDFDTLMGVIYMEDDIINKDVDDSFYDSFETTSGFTYDSTEDGIHIYKQDDQYATLVVDDGIAVGVLYKDKDAAVEMTKTIEFADD